MLSMGDHQASFPAMDAGGAGRIVGVSGRRVDQSYSCHFAHISGHPLRVEGVVGAATSGQGCP
jgi:hypothetical protein